MQEKGVAMPNSPRIIILSIVVFIFIVANIIAGVYKWGAGSDTTGPQKSQTESAEAAKKQSLAEQTVTETEVAPKKGTVKPVGEKFASTSESESRTATSPSHTPDVEQKNAISSSEPPAEKNSELEAQTAYLKKRLQAAIEDRQRLEAENDTLRTAAKVSHEIAAREKELQDKVVSYENSISRLEKEIAVMRNDVIEQKSLQSQNQTFSRQIQECTAERSRLQQEVSELQAAVGEKQELAAKHKQLENQSMEWTRSRKNLEDRISQQQTLIDQCQNVNKANQQLQAKVESAAREIENLKARLERIKNLVTAN
jgi:DNA repair exonuclease SbcCD ATPase subunit